MHNSTSTYMDIYNKYFMSLYNPIDFVPVSGKGSRLYDINGKELIDFAGGVAATALGQANPDLIEALVTQAHKLWHVGNIYTNLPQLELAQKLVENSCCDKVFLCNTGAEAVESALKLARRYAIKTFGNHKYNIVSCHNSFHGRSLLAVAAGGQPKYWEGFAPLPSGIRHVNFNQIEALDRIIDDTVAAVIVEPIQAESGVFIANYEFLAALRKLCDKHNCALIFDEVQTGMGRTGKLYAYMNYGIEPDIITLAKALAGGFPIGAVLAKKPFHLGFEPGSHGATFGGNPLACSVANKSFDLINNPTLLAGVNERHQIFMEELHKLNKTVDIYQEFRGQGLLIGAELKSEYHGLAFDIVHFAQKHGVSVLNASLNVTRFLPSLIIPIEDIKLGMQRLTKALLEFKKLHPVE